MMRKLQHKLIKNSLIVMVGTFLGGLSNYAFHFFVSKKMDIANYGELQSLISVITLLGFMGYALNYFVIRNVSLFAKRNDVNATYAFTRLIETRLLRLSVYLFLGFIILTPLIYWYLKLSDMWGLIIMVVSSILGLFITLHSGLLTGWEKFLFITITTTGGIFVKLIAGIILSAVFPTASVVSFSFLISTLVTFLLIRRYSRSIVGYNLDEKQESGQSWQKKYFPNNDIKKSIMPTTIFIFLMMTIGNIDILIVKNITTPEMTGYYSALSLLGKVIFWLNSSVITAILPDACSAGFEEIKRSKRLLIDSYGLVLPISLCLMVAFIAFPTLLLTLLFRSEYAFFSNLLWLFGFEAVLISFLTMEANFHFARHDFRVNYILLITAGLMILTIYEFHSSLREIIIGLCTIISLGYVCILLLNLFPVVREQAKP